MNAAGRAIGEANASTYRATYPLDCRRTSSAGIQAGDRLDVAVLKLDDALTRQNARTLRCARWYDQH